MHEQAAVNRTSLTRCCDSYRHKRVVSFTQLRCAACVRRVSLAALRSWRLGAPASPANGSAMPHLSACQRYCPHHKSICQAGPELAACFPRSSSAPSDDPGQTSGAGEQLPNASDEYPEHPTRTTAEVYSGGCVVPSEPVALILPCSLSFVFVFGCIIQRTLRSAPA